MLSGQARMLGKSRQLTYHKSSPILPGEPRRTSPLLLRWNRTILMVSCDGFEPSIDVRKPSVLPFELTGHRYFFVGFSCDIHESGERPCVQRT